MASTTVESARWFDKLLPDYAPNFLDAIHARPIGKLVKVVEALPEQAAPTVILMEYWIGYKSWKDIPHHFVCATLHFPDDQLKLIIERDSNDGAPKKQLASSGRCEAKDQVIIFHRDHPYIDLTSKKPARLEKSQSWKPGDGFTLLELVAVAQTLSTLSPEYCIYGSQCFWYASMIYALVPKVGEETKVARHKLFLRLEDFVFQLVVDGKPSRFKEMLDATRQQLSDCAVPALAPTLLSSTSVAAVGVHSSTDSSSGVESTTTVPTPTETVT